MEKFIVKGGNRLEGEVSISGAKNAVVGLIPATVLAGDTCIIENLPHIADVLHLSEILNNMGIKSEFIDKHTLKVESGMKPHSDPQYDLVNKIRASYYFIGALLAKYKRAEVALPGGCNFGGRPIDQHIKGFEALGAKVVIEHGVVKASADKLIGANIYMDVVSVGATINVMLAATMAEGTTVIENAAREPHVVDVANFLNSIGANIKGAGTDEIKIEGVSELGGSTYAAIPDQIEAGTYMVAAAMTEGDVTIKNVIPKHLESITSKLREMGVSVEEAGDSVRVYGERPYKAINVKTLPYPGFPTDMQPQMLTLLSTAEGNSIVRESVFDNRFQYLTELIRFGANVSAEGKVAVVNGTTDLTGAEVKCTDLRGGVSMILMGLNSKGETKVSDIRHVDRGYENIVSKLRGLGADITRIEE
ncbi:MAG: UDP-N-acetylglucosamine 1-carboxyvinyltransferase [Clostridia bacterium]|jgi:UDP-N-acetylglucosamine 1-carboxyvinyltransferase|nr:UDP-N-acetylglucosamine 1-carboxyvinyltransferase [Clostridia bacterium]